MAKQRKQTRKNMLKQNDFQSQNIILINDQPRKSVDESDINNNLDRQRSSIQSFKSALKPELIVTDPKKLKHLH